MKLIPTLKRFCFCCDLKIPCYVHVAYQIIALIVIMFFLFVIETEDEKPCSGVVSIDNLCDQFLAEINSK